MRIAVIHPGARFSTHDVYIGVVGGLRACGVDVIEERLDTILEWYASVTGAGIAAGVLAPNALSPDVLNMAALASAHVTRHILMTQPDAVLVVSGHNYHALDAKALRAHGYPVVVLLTESPYFGDVEQQIASHYTACFTNERRAAPLFRAAGLDCHYLPHAYNPAIHAPHGPAEAGHDALFIGSLFDERRALFAAARAAGCPLSLLGYDLSRPEDAAQIVPNERAAALYRGTPINVNHHRTTRMHGSGEHIAAGEAESLGPRAYEIAACGGFQVMDDSRAEACEVFGDSLVTYRAGDAADLARVVDYYLRHDDERRALAAAQHAAVRPHTWTARAADILAVLEQYTHAGAADGN